MLNKHLLATLLPLTMLLIAGCSTKPNVKNNAPIRKQPVQTVSQQPVTAIEPPPTKEKDPINYCRQALQSLKQINSNKALKYNDAFNNLVGAASQYNSVRTSISQSTRQAVDAMYQFKTAKLCADIDKELLDSLIYRGERSVR